jgi:hypothetical protein
MDINEDERDQGEEVYLKYEISSDHSKNKVFLSFTGFESEEQLEYFKEFMKKNLPLILHSGTMQ